MTLPPELCKEVMRLIFAYAFDDQEPEEDVDPIAKGFYFAFKSRFDMNVARLERAQANGRKGGAPKGNQNARKKATTDDAEETTKINPKQPKTTEKEDITTENDQGQPTPEEINPKQTKSISKSILTSTTVEDKEKQEKEKQPQKRKKEKEKIAFASSVRLTQDEYNAFVEQFGEAGAKELIEILNDYKEANGKRYSSDAAAIRSWVVDRYLQRQTRPNYGQQQSAAAKPTGATHTIPSELETPPQPPRRFKGTL